MSTLIYVDHTKFLMIYLNLYIYLIISNIDSKINMASKLNTIEATNLDHQI